MREERISVIAKLLRHQPLLHQAFRNGPLDLYSVYYFDLLKSSPKSNNARILRVVVSNVRYHSIVKVT
jgi:hypothetical protein